MSFSQVETQPGKLQQSLVPMACLLNHECMAPHIRQYGRINGQLHAMLFPASTACQRGDQICMSYGQLPNWRLLLFYGFALASNQHDTLEIQLSAVS